MPNILDFGARPDSNELSTDAFQAAIDAAGRQTVTVPTGTYRIGTINLRQASLYLERGACIEASTDLADYEHNGYDHNEMGKVSSLIYSLDSEGVRLHGHGTIDLCGDAFFDLDRPVLPDSRIPLSEEQEKECTRAYEARPNQPLFFLRCQNVRVEGIRILNAPCWTLTFVECQDVRVQDLAIDNSLILPNNDGLHFCSCRQVFVSGCNIRSGDDCIAVTGITDWDKPCEDIIISDCILQSCSKAISIGYMHSIVRNVLIQNVIIRESNRGLSLMSSHKTGLIENVIASQLFIETRIRAGNWWGNGEAICLMAAPHHNSSYARPAPSRGFATSIRNVSIRQVQVESENALAIVGKETNIAGIQLSDIAFKQRPSPNLPLKGNSIDLSPSKDRCDLGDDKAYWLVLREARDVRIRDIFLDPLAKQSLEIFQERCTGLRLDP